MDAAPTAAPFDAVFFDLDGTLADSAADIRRALSLAFREIGIEAGARLEALVDGSPLEEVFAVAVPDGSPADRARFIEAYRRHYEAGLVRDTRLYPGVRETLEVLTALRPRLRLAVTTTKRESTALALVAALGIETAFDRVAGSGASAIAPKPAPDLLLRVAQELSVAPARVLVVGDTLRDVMAGRRAGMRTAAVTYGLGAAHALLDARPDFLLEEFDELLVLLGMRA